MKLKKTSLKRNLILRVSGSSAFPKLAKYVVRADEYVTKDGNYQNSLVRMAGMKPIILFIPGRKSGTMRQVRLLTVRVDDDYIVVGSNWGKPEHPEWSINLLEVNEVDAITRGVRNQFKVQHLTEKEVNEIWPLLIAEWPNYSVYQDRTDRKLRVFRLQQKR